MPDDAGQFLREEDVLFNFWIKAEVTKAEECWRWKGSDNGLGYGQFRVDGKMMLAHRLAYLDVGKEIRAGQVLRHICNTPGCINPTHMVTGSQKENIHDAINAGRFRYVDPSLGGKASAAAKRAKNRG